MGSRDGHLPNDGLFEVSAVQEVFSMQVLPGIRSAELINDQPALLAEAALRSVAEALCHMAHPQNRALYYGTAPQYGLGDSLSGLVILKQRLKGTHA
jgi:hypothetical protein